MKTPVAASAPATSFKVSLVTIRGDKMTIQGPYGTKVIEADKPAEIGLAVIETLTGDMVAPPRAYRKGMQ